MPNHRKPKGAKILQGTFRKDRANPNEPDPLPLDEIPKPPKDLPKSGKDEWNNIIAYLVENQIVGAEGLSIVENYCRLHAALKEQPIMLIPASYIAQYRALACSLCLTPDGRAKFKMPQKQPIKTNKFEAFK